MTTYGTCYFPTREAAACYYKPYAKLESPEHWLTKLAQMIQRKLEEGEIYIGKPPLKPGQTAFVRDHRWHVQEATQPLSRRNARRVAHIATPVG